MNRLRSFTLAVSALALTFGLSVGVATIASATGSENATRFAGCVNLADWYVNEDETDRKPEPTTTGLKFSGTDLVHHAADVKLADLDPGSFIASPAPDQASFFSVEVRNTGGAYGTLRWDGDKWSITIGAGTGPDGVATDGTFSGTDPVSLLTGKVTKWGAFDTETAKVVSFGVGYTKNPAGTVDTVVSRVVFGGHIYGLSCPKPGDPTTQPTTASPSASSSKPATKPTTIKPSSSGSAAPGGAGITSGTAGPSLPVTGPSIGLLLTAGGIAVIAGAGLLIAARRRKVDLSA